VQGNPQNFGLMLHWDGFSLAKTSPENCWTKDLVILNFSKEYILDPLLTMFIPISSKTIIKQINCDVLSTFLKLLMTDLD
jgi:hypothetical protein